MGLTPRPANEYAEGGRVSLREYRPSTNVEIRRRRYQRPLDRELYYRDALDRGTVDLRKTGDVDDQMAANDMQSWLHMTGDLTADERERLSRERLSRDLTEMRLPRPAGFEDYALDVRPVPEIVEDLPGYAEGGPVESDRDPVYRMLGDEPEAKTYIGPYEPTWRESLKYWLMGDSPSPTQKDFATGLSQLSTLLDHPRRFVRRLGDGP